MTFLNIKAQSLKYMKHERLDEQPKVQHQLEVVVDIENLFVRITPLGSETFELSLKVTQVVLDQNESK